MKWTRYIILLLFLPAALQAQEKMQAVSFSAVKLQDKFWKSRADQVNKVTIPVCIEYTENKTGRIRNFERAAGLLKDSLKHEGIYYDDSDVYKALEAMAYSLKLNPDAALERKADEWIAKIAAAQEPDGYINTFYSLTGLDKRWTDMTRHEDYCAGHLIEAGIAYYYATGKRTLMDAGIKMADHMAEVFGPEGKHWVAGHQEVELALVKLYKVTNNKKYLRLAEWFLDERGRGHGAGFIWSDKKWGAPYCQDDVPVAQISNIQGHAVRAMYYYSAIADISSLTGNQEYLKAMERVWEDVVHRNMYLTGAIGSSRQNEGFTKDFDLPNFDAYGETCASVGMVFWNQRMNLLSGEAKYIDVLERSLYNGALAGLSLKGDQFFYPNPLASYGGYERRPWFGTACCPSNIARLLASLGDYIYANTTKDIWVNLFVGSEASIKLPGNAVKLSQQTDYPFEGSVKIKIEPERRKNFSLHIRIPGWASQEAAPGGLYSFENQDQSAVVIKLNGSAVGYSLQKGYAVINRNWQKGDIVELVLPMTIRKVRASEQVGQNRNKVAIQRGPLVYCLEGADNHQQVFSLLLPEGPAGMQAKWEPGLLGGLTTITGTGRLLTPSPQGAEVSSIEAPFKAIPYYAWANRGGGQMQVWLPARVTSVTLNRE